MLACLVGLVDVEQAGTYFTFAILWVITCGFIIPMMAVLLAVLLILIDSINRVLGGGVLFLDKYWFRLILVVAVFATLFRGLDALVGQHDTSRDAMEIMYVFQRALGADPLSTVT